MNWNPTPPHQNRETVLNLAEGGGEEGLFRKKRQASIIEGDFVKKVPYQMYLKNLSWRVSF